MKSGEMKTLLLPDCKGNFQRISEAVERFLKDLYDDGIDEGSQIFAIMILDKRTDYPRLKNIFTRQGILSQMILKFTAKKMNLSVASNIMKQINSKVGGESLRMKMPSFIYKEKVMTIGIDVCHAGKKSVVGFCASTNQAQTAYYSDIIIQPKG